MESEEDIHCIAVAEDGEQAVKLTGEYTPDVALIDIEMPKVDGIEAARQIKMANPATAVIILSAYKDDNYVLACMENGVNGYLLKDVHRSELINAIRIVHAGEGVFNLEVTKSVLHGLATSKDKEQSDFSGLHCREFEVLKLAAGGMSNKEIARTLGISIQTVGTHFVNIFRKLEVGSRMEATLYALKKRWFTIDELS